MICLTILCSTSIESKAAGASGTVIASGKMQLYFRWSTTISGTEANPASISTGVDLTAKPSFVDVSGSGVPSKPFVVLELTEIKSTLNGGSSRSDAYGFASFSGNTWSLVYNGSACPSAPIDVSANVASGTSVLDSFYASCTGVLSGICSSKKTYSGYDYYQYNFKLREYDSAESAYHDIISAINSSADSINSQISSSVDTLHKDNLNIISTINSGYTDLQFYLEDIDNMLIGELVPYLQTMDSRFSDLQKKLINIQTVLNNNASNIKSTIQTESKKTTDAVQQGNSLQEEGNKISGGIFASITDFFGSFFDNLFNSIVSLFVPSDDTMADLFDQLNQFFAERFGFLYAPFDYMIRLCKVFTSSTGSTALTFPGFSIMGEQVWADQTYDLASDKLVSTILEYVRTGTGILLAGYFIMYLQHFFKERFGTG